MLAAGVESGFNLLVTVKVNAQPRRDPQFATPSLAVDTSSVDMTAIRVAAPTHAWLKIGPSESRLGAGADCRQPRAKSTLR